MCGFAGSCLLWVMSTEISVDVAVDIAVDSRSTVGRHSVDTRSTLGRHSVDTRSILGRYSGQWSVDSRSTLGRDTVNSRSRCVSADRESDDSRSIYRLRFLSVCMVFSPLSIALEKKLEQDY